ncbi:manganese-dependent inorganic pyrophosphatase [Patescibacteria group bacterium]|nr:manganese-dependent inorganic pyrophosphatase [Patescibacteria group bacterium]MBU1885183.1 manganese-dependent inorganic pyrophosphatase [Patescibacteria group bacterium]
MPKTYIIGHLKPDTDAVVAAMALEYLFLERDCFGYDQPQAVITDPLSPETNYLFDKFKVEAPPLITVTEIGADDQVVLVDHNEKSQRLTGLDEARIVEIVDHHKANLNLSTPVFLNFKPWGSTATIVYFFMEENGVTPDKKLAALMLAAIISDTVGFKSATTTDKDRKFGAKLAKLAEINDIDAFAFEIFKAKSDISTLNDEEIVQNDYKIYEFDQKTFISQLETIQQETLLAKKDQLLAAMANVKSQLEVELLFVAVTDVLQINTKLLLAGEAEVITAERAFGGSAVDYILDIGPKMSRKKEIAPAIEKVLKNNN